MLKKEGEVRRETVNRKAAREVVLDVGETVGQRKRELGDRVRPRLGDVVAGDGHRIEVPDAVPDEELLHVPHEPQGETRGEDAGVLGLVLLEDVGLHGAAHALQRPRRQLLELGGPRRTPPLAFEDPDLLPDRGVQEHGQDGRGGTVDRHRDARRGIREPEPVEQVAHVVERGDRNASLPDLPEDVGPPRRVVPVERHAVERDREPRRGLGFRQQVEPAVRAGGAAFSGELPPGALLVPTEREDP